MANFIEDWLYKGATNPRSYYANLPLKEALSTEWPGSKYFQPGKSFGIPTNTLYEGFNRAYAGEGKSGLPRYAYEGARSFGGGQHGNIAGGTTGMRALYERAAPWIGKAARGIGRVGSAASRFSGIGAFGDIFLNKSKGISQSMGDVNRWGGLTNNPNTGRLEPRSNFEARMGSDANRGFSNTREGLTNYGKAYQKGGSVNPHEETTRAAREWNTREQPSRPWGGEPYRPNPDREWAPPKGEPYRPSGNVPEAFPLGDDEGIFNTVKRRIEDNPIFQKSKNIYDWTETNPWIPDINLRKKRFGYNFDRPLGGGDLYYGVDYDVNDDDLSAYFNWGKRF